MQNTWPDHHQHPWFATPTLKRKSEPEGDDETSGQQRKRLHKLERGLADLTIHHAQNPSASSPTTTHVVHPTSIEEPPSEPPIKDVKMSSGSWYELEKDRIVITDLDDSESELEEEEPEFKISPAFLDILNKKLPISVPLEKDQVQNKALILFQPRDPPKPVEEPVAAEPDPDAMDVEL